MNLMNEASVFLGKPITSPALISVRHTSSPSCVNEPFMVNGDIYFVTCLSFKNPHGVVFVEDLSNTDVAAVGPTLEAHPRFPAGANIVFAQVLENGSLAVRLWQKGVGEVDFSPEGACVAGAAAIMLQRVLDHEVNVNMGGRSYTVKWDRVEDIVALIERSA